MTLLLVLLAAMASRVLISVSMTYNRTGVRTDHLVDIDFDGNIHVSVSHLLYSENITIVARPINRLMPEQL